MEWTLYEILKRIHMEFFARDEFDRVHGTETSRLVHRTRLHIGKTTTTYQPCTPELFEAACRVLPQEALAYPFFDLGCGKGRVLIMAHEFGFKRVAGVELSNRLAKICRRNVAKVGLSNITVLREDATTFALPDSPMVVFMYNPFTPPTFDRVIERLSRHPHPVFITYINPKYREAIDKSGRFKPLLDIDYTLVCRSHG